MREHGVEVGSDKPKRTKYTGPLPTLRKLHIESQQLGCFRVYYQNEFSWLLNRQIGGFGAFEYLVYIARGILEHGYNRRTVTQEQSGIREHSVFRNCGQPITLGGIYDQQAID
jgi:hypothetical protein